MIGPYVLDASWFSFNEDFLNPNVSLLFYCNAKADLVLCIHEQALQRRQVPGDRLFDRRVFHTFHRKNDGRFKEDGYASVGGSWCGGR
jgi:hypothetical protein